MQRKIQFAIFEQSKHKTYINWHKKRFSGAFTFIKDISLQSHLVKKKFQSHDADFAITMLSKEFIALQCCNVLNIGQQQIMNHTLGLCYTF